MNNQSTNTASASHRDKGGRNHLWLSVLLLLALTLGTIFVQASATFAQEEGIWSGVVTDESGNPLPALVTINGVSVQTGDDGRFELKAPAGENDRQIINATLIGYATISRIHIGSPLQEMRLAMKKMQRFDIQPDQPIEVEDERGTRISIPAGGLIRQADGSPAKEPLTLDLHTYDLRNEQMVGDMTGINAAGETVGLISYGAFEAKFRNAEGELYNLAPGIMARISVPVSDGPDAPDWMPLWYYSLEKGAWIEDGKAVREGDYYSGEVSHFTSWNFDVEFTNPACVRITVDAAYLAANAPLDIRAEILSPPTVKYLWITSSPNALIYLPAFTDVYLYMPSAAITPFAVVNTGAPMGGAPAFPYLSCNGSLHIVPPDSDVGDAADNTNNFGVGMTTYPSGIAANFPTTYRGLGGIPGMIHWNPIADSWLGLNVSGEFDADLLPDADPVTNIDPTSNSADRDSFDDGVRTGTLSLGNCITNTFQYDLRVVGARKLRYVNVWMDYNRDGDWNDTIRCRDASGRTRTFTEWVVRNRASNLAPRVAPYTFVTPAFWSVNPPTPTNPMWMRMTLAESQAVTLTAALADGRGPASGYRYGETEDYYLTRPIVLAAEDQPVDVDWETVVDIDTQALLAEIEAFTDNHIDTEADALPETAQEETFTGKRVYVPFVQK